MKYTTFKTDEKQQALFKCLQEFNDINNSMNLQDLTNKYGVSVNAFYYYRKKQNVDTQKLDTIYSQKGGNINTKTNPMFENTKKTKYDVQSEWWKNEIHKNLLSEKDDNKPKQKRQVRLTMDDITLFNDT